MTAAATTAGAGTGASTRVGGDIVLVGGYGHVGRRLAGFLAPRFPGRVVLAGRTLPAARAGAASAGHGTRAAHLDAEDPHAAGAGQVLTGAAVVVACAAARTPALAEADQAGQVAGGRPLPVGCLRWAPWCGFRRPCGAG